MQLPPTGHQSVLLPEVIAHLKLGEGKRIVDCTVGRGGHSLAIAQMLLARGADVGGRNSYGGTALHDAAMSGHTDLVRLLLDHSAALDARDDESGATPLYVAAAMGRSEVVKLLVEKGADVNLATRAGDKRGMMVWQRRR